MISIFSKISGLYTLWNALSLKQKIELWFGKVHNKKLSIYHKIAFWNQSGWDRRTFEDMPNLIFYLKNSDDFNTEFLKIKNSNYKVPEKTFLHLWK